MFRNSDLLREFEIYANLERNVVLVSFDPWAVHSRKHLLMLQRMLAEGFRVLAFDHSRLTEADIEQVYRKNHPIGERTAWHLPRHVYSLGITCTVLLFHQDAGIPAVARMKELKGNSSPLVQQPGQLRYDFRAPNKSLSLVHSSDDWESTLHEGFVFFSPAQLHACFNDIGTPRFDRCERTLLHSSSHEGMEIVREQAATGLLFRLRVRLVEQLAGACDPTIARTLLERWHHMLEEDVLALDVKTEHARYIALVAGEQRHMEALLQSLSTRKVDVPRRYVRYRGLATAAGLLWVLSRPADYPYVEVERLLAGSPVALDKWEDLLLRTTLFHSSELEHVASEP
jgi:nucleoside diphosphate kinase